MKVLIIIPAYNEQECIKGVVDNLIQNYPQYDYVVINDGSKDDTLKILEENNYSYINLPGNLGIGGAMQTGYLYAYENGYDIAVQLDGDGQHNPAYIKDIIAPIVSGEADMVIGSRYITGEGFQSTGLRRLGIKIISTTIRLLCGKKVLDVTSGFRASNRKMVRFFSENYAEDYPEPEAIIATIKQGGEIKEVPVLMNERQGGVSSISGFKAVNYMVKVELALLINALRKGVN